jgi:peptide-methionine (S)-S-oxide reductase
MLTFTFISIISFFFGQLLFVTTNSFNNNINIYSNRNKMTIRTMTMARTEDTEISSSSSSSLGKKRPLRSVQTMLIDNDSSTSTTRTGPSSASASATACVGDIVTLNIQLTPEDGYVPDHLFDSSGEITFVLGWGNYLPGLHELLLSGTEEIKNISIDAGFGRHNPELVIEVPKTNLKKVKHIEKIQPNTTLNLQGGIQVNVLEVTKDTIIVDANHPLAGSSYLCSFKVLSIDKFPIHKLQQEEAEEETDSSSTSPFDIATFAMGCFWGLELAFMRTNGIIGTRAGYTQGIVPNPSYDEISEGSTKHREAVMVIYDSRIVSYKDILTIYNDRLAATAPEYFKLDIFADDDDEEVDNNNTNTKTTEDSLQYKHGIYFHNDEQKQQANEFILSSTSINNMNNRYHCDVELLPANIFYNAEDQHQQYLYKGGQAARKGCRDIIRCYG